MSEPYYILTLDEPASPGYCSLDKIYVGTESQIRVAAANLKKSKDYPETVKAINNYLNGSCNATHNIAYSERRVLEPVKVISEHETFLQEHKWTHINIWGFPYEMKCDKAKIHQIVFKYENNIYRCIRAWFDNLSYSGTMSDWMPLTDGFWGNASLLDVSFHNGSKSFTFNNLLYVIAEIYDTGIDAAIADMSDENKFNFKNICNEIFADG